MTITAGQTIRELVGADTDDPVLVIHGLSDDGTQLTSVLKARGRTVTLNTGWNNAQQAAENIDAAISDIRDRAVDLADPHNTSEHHKLKKTAVGTVGFTVLAGPPTWWIPRPKLELGRHITIGGGWLRRAVYLHFKPFG